MKVFLFLFVFGGWISVQQLLVGFIGEGATTITVLFCFMLAVMLTVFTSKRYTLSRYEGILIVLFLAFLLHFAVKMPVINYPQKFLPIFIVLPLGVLYLMSSSDLARVGSKQLILATMLLLIPELLITLLSTSDSGGRQTLSGATSGSTNHLAIYCLVLYLAVYHYNRRWLGFAFICLIVSILLTKSRGNFLAAVFVLYLLHVANIRSVFSRVLLLFGLAVLALWAAFEMGIVDRFLNSYETDYENKLGRIHILLEIYKGFIADPVFGYGIGRSDVHIRFDSHNYILESLMEGGLIVFFACALVFKRVFKFKYFIDAGVDCSFYYYCFLVAFIQGMFSGSVMLSIHFWVSFIFLLKYEKVMSVKGWNVDCVRSSGGQVGCKRI